MTERRDSLRWRRDEEGGVLPSVWRTEAKADRQPQLSSLYVAGGLWQGHRPVLFPLPSLDGGGGEVIMEVVGRGCFLFSDVASDDPGGPAPPTPPADEG